MGRKKKKQVKPWCWYCGREFDDESILIQHQKSRHFKCPLCHRKLYNGPGLSIHCNQVHKEKLDKIPNALPNRTSTVIDIYGMDGIPEADLIEHEKRKLGLGDDEIAAKVKKTDEGPSFYPIVPPPITFLPAVAAPYAPIGAIPGVPLPPPISTVPVPPPPPPPPPPSAPFPAVVNSVVSDKSPSVTPKATFPAYSSPNQSVKPKVSKVPKPLSGVNGVTVDLIHPSDDLSLEEIRAKSEKYKRLLEAAINPKPVTSVAPPPTGPFVQTSPGLMPTIGLAPAPTMAYPGVPPQLAQRMPFAGAPGFMPHPIFGIPGVPPNQSPIQPWPGMPMPRF